MSSNIAKSFENVLEEIDSMSFEQLNAVRVRVSQRLARHYEDLRRTKYPKMTKHAALLKAKQAESGLNQREFAKRIHSSRGLLDRMYNKDAELSFSVLYVLAKRYGIDANCLL